MCNSWKQASDEFKAMMIGKLLGDGSITKQKGRNPRFQFMHVDTDYEWAKYCYDCLRTTISLAPPKYKETIDSRLIKGYSLSYYVQSKTSNIITYLRSEWYPFAKKVLPYDLISKHFNETSLAWWYMDDGHLKQKDNIPKKIILSTDSFSLLENKSLIHFLHEKYNLSFRLDKQNRIILYDQFQIYYFLHLVTPHMHHSMHRKFISICNLKQLVQPRRTTIYLPKSIILNSPTADINDALAYLARTIETFKMNRFYSIPLDWSNEQTRGYQIIINEQNISALEYLKQSTGLTYSELTELCFQLSFSS